MQFANVVAADEGWHALNILSTELMLMTEKLEWGQTAPYMRVLAIIGYYLTKTRSAQPFSSAL